MRPEGPVARRSDYRVEKIEHAAARQFIERRHYARGAANTSLFAHGLFRVSDDTLVGAALWMPPTKVAAQSVAGEDWRRVIALSRLAVAPGEPKNTTGLFLARSTKLVFREDARWIFALTYADEREGHTGIIYRACGWHYVGPVKGDPKWVDAEGKQVARKSTKSRTNAEMVALGYTRLPPAPKHKFVLRFGDR